MLTLAAAGTIGGDADAATSLSVTINGMELNGSTEVYKVLYQGQLGVAAATLYTVPASTTAFVKTITVVNTDVANPRTFQFFVNGLAASNAVTSLMSIPKGGMALYEDGKGWSVYNSAGQILNNIYSAIASESNYSLSGYEAETIPRNLCPEVNTTMPASGTLFMQAIFLRAGQVVNSISLHSATTAAGTPTNYFAGLYDSLRNLVASSANKTTTAWGANTKMDFAMTVPYTVPADGLYYIGYFMTATTMPTLKGGTTKTGGQLAGQNLILHGNSNTGLTTALPNPANAITVGTLNIWAGVS